MRMINETFRLLKKYHKEKFQLKESEVDRTYNNIIVGDAEKIAYSRHKNINRLQQTPVTYTKSLFEELKLRLGVETDEEVKRILRRLYNLENPEKGLKENETDRTYRNVTVGVFSTESISWISFVRNNRLQQVFKNEEVLQQG